MRTTSYEVLAKGISGSNLAPFLFTRWLKDDAKEFLDTETLRALIVRHAEYGASPIFLWTETTEEVPIESDEEPAPVSESTEEDEVKVEEEEKPVQTKTVVKGEWERVNDIAPLWMRDPKDVSDEQYEEFFKGTFKDTNAPLAWSHFKVSSLGSRSSGRAS